MVEQQPEDHPDIQHLFKWADRVRQLGVGDAELKTNRPFIPDSEIEAYFGDDRRIRKLLAAVKPGGNPQLNPVNIRTKYPKVFLILLLTGNGHFISYFVRHDSLCDQYLPFRTKPQQFPHASKGDLFELFCSRQWEFCAQIFHDGDDQQFDAKDLILPIISKEKLGGGGSATVHKIVLHPAYDKLSGKRNARGSANEDTHTFVLKTYNTPDAEDYYQNEVSGFLNENVRGGSNTNIIGFHKSFIWHGTYNVLLEYADRGTLEQYYNIVDPPTSREDIVKFYRELFKILPALAAIHGVRVQPSHSGSASRFQGWHQDVKPSNILVKSKKGGSPYDCEFLLADLGLSHFKKEVPSHGEATDRDTYGTRAYGAPECYRADVDIERIHLPVTQKVDIWSLGCVFSETAVWLVLGAKELKEYRRRRGKETEGIPNFRDGNCFHDGQVVLDSVKQIHKTLPAAEVRVGDHVTSPMLDMVTNKMLVNVKHRKTATDLSTMTTGILNDAMTKLRDQNLYAGTGSASGSALESPPRTPPEAPPGHFQARSSNSHKNHIPSYTHTGSPASMSYDEDSVHRQGYEFGPLSRRASQQAHSDWLTRPQRTCPFDQDEIFDTHLNRAFSEVRPSQDSADSPGWLEPLSTNSRRRRTSSGRFSDANTGYALNIPCQIPQETCDVNKRNAFTDSPVGLSRTNTATLVQAPHNAAKVGQHHSRIAQGPRLLRVVSPDPSKFHPCTEPQARQRPPVLSVTDAQRWKRDKKEQRPCTLPGDHSLADLDQRDHVFLIDDSSSMKPYCSEVRDLFELLVYMVKSKDPDGIDLHFTIRRDKKARAKNTRQLLRTLDMVSYSDKSNIRLELGKILQGYHTKLRDQDPPRLPFLKMRARRPARPMTVYILTDGVWQPDCDLAPLIENLVNKLGQHSMEREQFGIQFIRFGDDPEGKIRLDQLDSGLGLSMDIVDTEPWNGNVFKMLYGAFNNWYDGDNVSPISNGLASPVVDTSRRRRIHTT